MKFASIRAEKAVYPVALMCRALDLSRSGYHAWEERQPGPRFLEEAELAVRVREIYNEHRGRYGAPRIHAQLQREGIQVSRKRVARIMRDRGLRARSRRRFRTTTNSQHSLPVTQNLLNRDFDVHRPNTVWAGDITYVWTREGWVYLAVLLDLCTRSVVGWAVSDRLHRDLCVVALRDALRKRKPPRGLLHHSDRGSQYASAEYRAILQQYGITCSMSRRGDCWDNAVAESFFATLKKELVLDADFLTRRESTAALFSYIEGYYNRQRLHSALGYRTPLEAEHLSETMRLAS